MQKYKHIGTALILFNRLIKNFHINANRTPKSANSFIIFHFVKSPATHDKTASLALYPNSNRFTDFSNGNYSGDCIAFVAYVKGCNQWQALKELQAFYGLTDTREKDRQEAQRRIQLQQEQERRKEERRQAFYRALWTQIDDLKRWAVLSCVAGLFTK